MARGYKRNKKLKQGKNAEDLKKVVTPVVGQKYHLAWANRGCVWRLIGIMENKEDCLLVTPKTFKEIVAKTKDLRHLI